MQGSDSSKNSLSSIIQDEDIIRYLLNGIASDVDVPFSVVELVDPSKFRSYNCSHRSSWFPIGCKAFIDNVELREDHAAPLSIKETEHLEGKISRDQLLGSHRITPCGINDVLILNNYLDDIKKSLEGVCYKCHMGFPITALPLLVDGKPLCYFFTAATNEVDLELISKRLKNFEELYPAFTLKPGSGEYILSQFEKQSEDSEDPTKRLIEARKAFEKYAVSKLKKSREDNFILTIGNNIQILKVKDLADLKTKVKGVLDEVREFLSAEYVAFFCNTRPEENPLQLQVWSSKSPGIIEPPRLHFNWNKAKLPKEPFQQWKYPALENMESMIGEIKGKDALYCKEPSMILPVYWENSNRGVIVVGPCNLDPAVSEDYTFFLRMANSVGTRLLNWFQYTFNNQREDDLKLALRLIHHRHRAGIGTIQPEAELVLSFINEGTYEKKKERVQEACKRIINETKLLIESQQQDLYIATLKEREKRVSNMQEMDLHVAVQIVVDRLSTQTHSRIEMWIDDEKLQKLPLIWFDPLMLDLLLTNVIQNAIKYSRSGTTVKIKGEGALEEVVLKIINEGIGIKPGEEKKILEKGIRGTWRGRDDSRVQKGEGLGLYHGELIMKKFSGHIEIKSEQVREGGYPGEWHEVTVSIHFKKK
jgi:signal transduction histidine kinase